MTPTTIIPEMNSPRQAGMSLSAKLLNMLASPGDVFDQVLAGPPRTAHWLVPTLLVCLIGIVLPQSLGLGSPSLDTLTPSGAGDSSEMLTHWRIIRWMSACLVALGGTLWTAFMLWVMGRTFLRSPVRFGRALEVAGLASTILLLGTIVTALLSVATGDPTVRPALSLFALRLTPPNSLRAGLDQINFFHLWTACVLAVGLGRLAGVRTKEAAFWVVGYWVVVRLGVLLLT